MATTNFEIPAGDANYSAVTTKTYAIALPLRHEGTTRRGTALAALLRRGWRLSLRLSQISRRLRINTRLVRLQEEDAHSSLIDPGGVIFTSLEA